MALRIIWSHRAENNFDKIIKYLEDEWGEQACQNFIRKTFSFLEILGDYPQLGKLDFPQKDIRTFALNKQTSIIYIVNYKHILILNIFNNYQDPKKKK